jgi:hypothetical protein
MLLGHSVFATIRTSTAAHKSVLHSQVTYIDMAEIYTMVKKVDKNWTEIVETNSTHSKVNFYD